MNRRERFTLLSFRDRVSPHFAKFCPHDCKNKDLLYSFFTLIVISNHLDFLVRPLIKAFRTWVKQNGGKGDCHTFDLKNCLIALKISQRDQFQSHNDNKRNFSSILSKYHHFV